MHAAIVTVGDEILAGHTLDTNSHFVAGRLSKLGVHLVEKRSVPDTPARIQGAVWELQERRDAALVITLGGLGPTHDDRTVAAVASLHGVPLVLHDETWERLSARYGGRHEAGMTEAPGITAAARKMAMVPAGAEVFPNAAGAAPGLAVRRALLSRPGDAWTVLLPGVPQEMHTLWEQHVEAFVLRITKGRAVQRHVAEIVFRGSESAAAQIFAAIETKHAGVTVGSYPFWGERRVVLRVAGADAKEVEDAAVDLVADLKAAGHDAERMPGATPLAGAPKA